eukprot:CAMPEP_0178439172 /NCGR_PEP_ID=MMETSP0689_2-20121128/36010_1 /TAXON_ID=160604 /ORGANISM="Amphidinium massartii, Strain CS-259" /LENGTH=75 /DNA_ID=CAMNT_0020061675 /DNA_START=96 /DNA_END=323 /DNA_ORIENTATION=-
MNGQAAAAVTAVSSGSTPTPYALKARPACASSVVVFVVVQLSDVARTGMRVFPANGPSGSSAEAPVTHWPPAWQV